MEVGLNGANGRLVGQNAHTGEIENVLSQHHETVGRNVMELSWSQKIAPVIYALSVCINFNTSRLQQKMSLQTGHEKVEPFFILQLLVDAFSGTCNG